MILEFTFIFLFKFIVCVSRHGDIKVNACQENEFYTLFDLRNNNTNYEYILPTGEKIQYNFCRNVLTKEDDNIVHLVYYGRWTIQYKGSSTAEVSVIEPYKQVTLRLKNTFFGDIYLLIRYSPEQEEPLSFNLSDFYYEKYSQTFILYTNKVVKYEDYPYNFSKENYLIDNYLIAATLYFFALFLLFPKINIYITTVITGILFIASFVFTMFYFVFDFDFTSKLTFLVYILTLGFGIGFGCELLKDLYILEDYIVGIEFAFCMNVYICDFYCFFCGDNLYLVFIIVGIILQILVAIYVCIKTDRALVFQGFYIFIGCFLLYKGICIVLISQYFINESIILYLSYHNQFWSNYEDNVSASSSLLGTALVLVLFLILLPFSKWHSQERKLLISRVRVRIRFNNLI